MNFGLSEEQQMIVDTVRNFVENEIYPFESDVEATGIVPKEDAEYYLRTQGSTAGVILDGFDYNTNTGRFMVGSRERLLEHDWTKIARFASGAPSIGLHDIAWGLRSPNIDQYLIHGITHDLITGVYDERPATLF